MNHKPSPLSLDAYGKNILRNYDAPAFSFKTGISFPHHQRDSTIVANQSTAYSWCNPSTFHLHAHVGQHKILLAWKTVRQLRVMTSAVAHEERVIADGVGNPMHHYNVVCSDCRWHQERECHCICVWLIPTVIREFTLLLEVALEQDHRTIDSHPRWSQIRQRRPNVKCGLDSRTRGLADSRIRGLTDSYQKWKLLYPCRRGTYC